MSTALAAWPDDPAVNVPICTADGIQEQPRITTDGASGAIIAWQDISSASSDIYVSRIDARGTVHWTKDGVAVCLEKDNQWYPDLVYDNAGGAIIAWWDERTGEMDIYAQRVNSDGELQWQSGGIPICKAPSLQIEFNITPDGEGGAILTWHDYRKRTGIPEIYAQRVNRQGKTLWQDDGVLVADGRSYQKYPDIVGDGAGGAIIAWQNWGDGKGDIRAQHLDGAGHILWQTEGVPVCTKPERQWHPAIVTDDGGAIIVWMDHRNERESEVITRADYLTGAGWDIYAQRVDAQGKMQWQEGGVPICTALGDQYDYSVVSDGANGAFIAWYDQRNGNWDIYAQRVNALGNVMWIKNGLAVCTEPEDQYNPDTASDGAGGVIISWWDKRNTYSDIYAQRISADGKFLWVDGGAGICLAKGSQQDPRLVNSGVGSAIITWWDRRKSDPDIYAQRVISE